MLKKWWLVQRLLDPPKLREDATPLQKTKALIMNPFAFGGGLLNGGFGQEAIKLLRPVIEFDYMGAAEYEFGDVPRAFVKLFGDKGLKFWVTSVCEGKRSKKNTGVTVMVAGSGADREDIDNRLQQIVDDKLQTRDATMFRDALGFCVCWRPKNRKQKEQEHYKWCPHHPARDEQGRRSVSGWIELETGTFWTTSKVMFDGMIGISQQFELGG